MTARDEARYRSPLDAEQMLAAVKASPDVVQHVRGENGRQLPLDLTPLPVGEHHQGRLESRRHVREVEENDLLRTVAVAEVAARRGKRLSSSVQLLHDGRLGPIL